MHAWPIGPFWLSSVDVVFQSTSPSVNRSLTVSRLFLRMAQCIIKWPSLLTMQTSTLFDWINNFERALKLISSPEKLVEPVFRFDPNQFVDLSGPQHWPNGFSTNLSTFFDEILNILTWVPWNFQVFTKLKHHRGLCSCKRGLPTIHRDVQNGDHSFAQFSSFNFELETWWKILTIGTLTSTQSDHWLNRQDQPEQKLQPTFPKVSLNTCSSQGDSKVSIVSSGYRSRYRCISIDKPKKKSKKEWVRKGLVAGPFGTYEWQMVAHQPDSV